MRYKNNEARTRVCTIYVSCCDRLGARKRARAHRVSSSPNYVVAKGFAVRFWITVALTFGPLDETIGGTWYDVAIDIFMPPRHALCERRDLSQGSLHIPQATVDCNVIIPRACPKASPSRHHRSIIVPALSFALQDERTIRGTVYSAFGALWDDEMKSRGAINRKIWIDLRRVASRVILPMVVLVRTA